MLNLGRLENLAAALGVDSDVIQRTLDDFDENPESLVSELRLWPADPNKEFRDVICMRGRWRSIQGRIYKKLLLRELKPTRFSHGGVIGRSAATNARAHIGNIFAFATDIRRFFPSISCCRVNDIFLRHGCHYRVARMLTRLCTYEFHLALGLTTSPILANEAAKPIDYEIAKACQPIGLTYTRLYDDITITGRYDVERSGIEGIVRNVLKRHGFTISERKTRYGRLDEDFAIAGARLKGTHLDASREFIDELCRLVEDHASLAQDGPFGGPLLVEEELLGKAHYACFLNKGRRRTMLRMLKEIDWRAAINNAAARGLCRYQRRLTKRDQPRPDGRLPLRTVPRRVPTIPVATEKTDHSVPPWEQLPDRTSCACI